MISVLVGHDPEAERAENLRKEEESLRQVMRQRKPIKSKRTKRTSGGAAGYGDEEGSEDEGGISIAAIKNKYKKGAPSTDKPIYSSDEAEEASDGSDFDTRRKKKDRSKPTKALKESDDDSDNASAGKHSGSDNEGSGKDSGSDEEDDD